MNKTSKKQWVLDCNYFEEMKNKALQTYDAKGLFQRLIVKNYSYFGRGERVFDGFSEDLPKELAESERVNWNKWLALYHLYDVCLSQPSSVGIALIAAQSISKNQNQKYYNSTLDSFFDEYVEENDSVDMCNLSFQSSKDLFINSRILWFASDAFQDSYKWGNSLSMLTHFGVNRPSFLTRILLS